MSIGGFSIDANCGATGAIGDRNIAPNAFEFLNMTIEWPI